MQNEEDLKRTPEALMCLENIYRGNKSSEKYCHFPVDVYYSQTSEESPPAGPELECSIMARQAMLFKSMPIFSHGATEGEADSEKIFS